MLEYSGSSSLFRQRVGLPNLIVTSHQENVDDPEEAVQIWEDYGVGLYLDTWVQMMPNGGDGWLTNLTEEALAVAEVGEIGTGVRRLPSNPHSPC